MPGQDIRTIVKRSFISYKGRLIDFPFQKNIHQLPQDEFIDCLHDLYFASQNGEDAGGGAGSFKEMLYARFGRSIAEKFLIPYNEKLYACDLGTLDNDAMGRFFPHADLTDIVRNMKTPDNASYNATFTYPEGGAIEYVKALASAVPPRGDRARRAADRRRPGEARSPARPQREIQLRAPGLVGAAEPLRRRCAGCPTTRRCSAGTRCWSSTSASTARARATCHWIYYPDRERVVLPGRLLRQHLRQRPHEPVRRDRLPAGAPVDVEAARARVLADLKREGLVTDHQLVADHSVVMDPAYVHITTASLADPRPGRPGPGPPRRPLHRPLRRLDLLLHRGQHRRGQDAGGGLG